MSASENQNPGPGNDPYLDDQPGMDDEPGPDDDEAPPPRTGRARVLWALVVIAGVISALGTLTIVAQIARLWWAL